MVPDTLEVILAGLGLTGLTAVASCWLAGRLARATRFGALDQPGDRSLHSAPTPRTGGVAILSTLTLGAGMGVLLAWSLEHRQLDLSDGLGIVGLGTAVLAGHSFWSDLHATTILPRLGVQVAVATIAVLAAPLAIDTVGFSLGYLTLPATVVALVWMTNLYNFMDGMDGFAAGMTIIGFGTLSALYFRGGQPSIGWLSILVIGATAGFLVYNFPPARIFLGDVGSVPLGFLAGCLSLMGIRDRLFDVWVPLLIFSPFVVDATVTVARRLLRGQRFWRPHREHYYQRLVLAGWGHRRTVLAEYTLMLACAATAVAYTRVNEPIQLSLLSGWAAVYCLLMFRVRALETRRSRYS
jgi:UDP-N-acetylmuramyl pentapeptide phosphotransferase/UDP-N-acetylglucosamine-1-phosphate transferase